MIWHICAFFGGILLDLLIGDPEGWPHIVIGMGRLTALLERALRRVFPKTDKGELAAGVVLCVLLPLLCASACFWLLYLCRLIHPALAVCAEAVLCWQCLAARSLSHAAKGVQKELDRGDLCSARRAVGMIVGRDTAALDEAGVARAAIETVAENTSDGVIAPMLFLAIGGAPLGVLYKAINTLDSTVGYKNDRYMYFGRACAKLDDAANFLPSRISGLLMTAAAALLRFDAKGALRIYKKDRLAHTSPNSAHTEAACAGALGLKLGGPSYYGGSLVEKPYIGDGKRIPQKADIHRCVRLMYMTAALACAACTVIFGGILLWN